MIFSACLYGAVWGLFNGLISRTALVKAVSRPDKIFYRVWVAVFLYKLFFLGIAALLLWKGAFRISPAPFLCGLVFTQSVIMIVPVKCK